MIDYTKLYPGLRQDIIDSCRRKGIDIMTSYLVCIHWSAANTTEMQRESILPYVVGGDEEELPPIFLCDQDMMTYLELTLGKHIKRKIKYITFVEQHQKCTT